MLLSPFHMRQYPRRVNCYEKIIFTMLDSFAKHVIPLLYFTIVE